MKFQVRECVGYDKEREKFYLAHLKKNKKKIPQVLWDYFSNDFFFHDGRILELVTAGSEVVIKLDAPNIKRFNEDGGFDFISAGFYCCFKEVYMFEIESLAGDSRKKPLSDMHFLYSEIDTAGALLRKLRRGGKNCNSLIIHTADCGGDFMIALVFGTVHVAPEEPLAYEFVKNNAGFEVPVPLAL